MKTTADYVTEESSLLLSHSTHNTDRNTQPTSFETVIRNLLLGLHEFNNPNDDEEEEGEAEEEPDGNPQ